MIHVVIPTLNEERRIGELLDALGQYLASRDWRAIHVDDGSTDGTVAVVAGRREAGCPVTTIRHPTNLNIGATFCDGFTAALEGAADDDVIALMEGDMTSDPSLLPALVDCIRADADVAIASRYRPGSGQPGFPFKRKLMSWVLNRLILRVFAPIPGVRDYSIFFRAYRAEPLRRAFHHWGEDLMTCPGFGANAELLCKVATLGAEYVEVPFVYNYGLCEGNSSIPIGRTIREYARLLRALRRR